MKYFLIAGEASGDLHAAHLMNALREHDPAAEFRFYGGDRMSEAGGTRLCHYRHLAYMGFIPVLLHLPGILRGMKRCKREIARWRPHCVILIDYPGFNLQVARYVHAQRICPVFYYISPKIWAWKEYRIRDIRRCVTRLFSILPFEKNFYEGKHRYPISYVGNPTVDEVARFRAGYRETEEQFIRRHGLEQGKPLIALLAGSRKQEIKDNLSRMYRAALPLTEQGYRLVVAGAPSIDPGFYASVLRKAAAKAGAAEPRVVYGATYPLLSHAKAALVTSGTATLETALLGVPQAVCYYVGCGKLVSFLRRRFLKVPYISLVNLVCGREVVPELVADGMNVANVRAHLLQLLPGAPCREEMLRGYEEMRRKLGTPGAPERAAAEMAALLRAKPPVAANATAPTEKAPAS